MLDLTPENYFGPENRAITPSKASLFKKSRSLYKRRILDREPYKITPSMTLGKVIDARISGEPCDERLTAGQQEKADHFIAEFLRNPFSADLLKSEKQVILQGKLGEIEIAGRPDFIRVTAKVIEIDDLKISSAAKVRGMFWTALEFGYHRSLAVYRELVRQKYGRRKKIVCRLVVGWEEQDVYRYKIFVLPKELLDQGWTEFKKLAKEISQTTDFSDPLISFKDAEILRAPGAKPKPSDDCWESI